MKKTAKRSEDSKVYSIKKKLCFGKLPKPRDLETLAESFRKKQQGPWEISIFVFIAMRVVKDPTSISSVKVLKSANGLQSCMSGYFSKTNTERPVSFDRVVFDWVMQNGDTTPNFLLFCFTCKSIFPLPFSGIIYYIFSTQARAT